MFDLAMKLSRIDNRVLVHTSYLSRQAKLRYANKQIKIGHEVYFSLEFPEIPKRARIAWNGTDTIIRRQ